MRPKLERYLRSALPNGVVIGDNLMIGNLNGDKGGSLAISISKGTFIDFANPECKGGIFKLISYIQYGVDDPVRGKEWVESYLSKYPKDEKSPSMIAAARPAITKKRNKEIVKAIWEKCKPLRDSSEPARYLKSRNLNWDYDCLREGRLKHISGGFFTCLVAAVTTESGEVEGIHRIYLKDGAKANITPCKMALGSIKGNSVKLGQPNEVLGVAEGIETAISAMTLLKLPTWSAISGGNIASIIVPNNVHTVIVIGDNDDAGRIYAEKAKDSFIARGLRSRIIYPDRNDFNDDLRGKYATRHN